MGNDTITRAILGYLLKHPDAGDTLEGIASWWIARELIESETTRITKIIEALLNEGFLLKQVQEDKTTFYYLNKEKLPDIENIIGDER